MLMYKQLPFKLSDTTLRKTPNSVQEEVNVLEVLVAVVVRGRAMGVGKQGTA